MTYTHPHDDWNPDDWQGRSREQVESSTRFAGYAFIGIVTIIALYWLITIF